MIIIIKISIITMIIVMIIKHCFNSDSNLFFSISLLSLSLLIIYLVLLFLIHQ